MMKLIGSHPSPFVRKVRIVMAEKKIDCELVLEDVWASDSKIHDYNPLGKVPCLILDDGEAVFDSRVICEYVDTLTPVGKLLPQERRERTEVRCWEALADGMLDAAVLILERSEGAIQPEAVLARIRALRIRDNAFIQIDPPPPLGTRYAPEEFERAYAERERRPNPSNTAVGLAR